MISTVVDRRTGKIMGWARGHTFKLGDVEQMPSRTNTYEVVFPDGDAESAEIQAANSTVAGIIAKRLWRAPFKMFEVKTSRKLV